MDAATHFLVPYAAALLVLGAWRAGAPPRRVACAVAFGVGGWAPDADVAVDWLSESFDALYFLQHRGLSHTLVGAPLFALAVMGVAALVARHWRAFRHFVWDWRVVGAALLGSLTHILLDGVTYGGVPLLWPFAEGRVTLGLFHWLVWWLFPVGAILAALHVARRIDRRWMAAGGACVVVILLVLAGLRLAARPDAPDGGHVYATAAHDEWVIVEPRADGWEVRLVRGGETLDNRTYVQLLPAEAEPAVQAARETDAYKGFAMGRFGPEVVQARAEGSAWNVTFLAVAQRFEAERDPRWTPAATDAHWGMAAFHVAGGKAEAVVRGW